MYALDSRLHYQMLRLAYLSSIEMVDVGIMCASPQGPDFSVMFENLTIQG